MICVVCNVSFIFRARLDVLSRSQKCKIKIYPECNAINVFHACLMSSTEFSVKITFFENFFQEYHLSVKQIGSRSGVMFCRV